MIVSSKEKALARIQNPKHVRKDKRRKKAHPAPENRTLTPKEQARAEMDAEMIERTGSAGKVSSRSSRAPAGVARHHTKGVGG
jgi:hypothetical protein